MKIVRYFMQHEGEDTGIKGFVPLWIPKSVGFDPMDAMGMMHDMLEHRLCDRGHYHEELMAFGRIIALRGIPGHLQRGQAMPPGESLGTELAGIWADALEGRDQDLMPAPGTTPVADYAEKMINNVAKALIDNAESMAHDRDQCFVPDAGFKRSARSWLRIGYLDALRRYGQQDHGCYDTGAVAFGWAENHKREINNLAEDGVEGMVLRLCFDTERMCMSYRDLTPRNDYEDFPEWLRLRIWRWNTQP